MSAIDADFGIAIVKDVHAHPMKGGMHARLKAKNPKTKKPLKSMQNGQGKRKMSEPNKRHGIAYNLARVMQCIECKNDPEYCGCTDDDEDEDGFCKKWEER